jgi:hypothetical protein
MCITPKPILHKNCDQQQRFLLSKINTRIRLNGVQVKLGEDLIEFSIPNFGRLFEFI